MAQPSRAHFLSLPPEIRLLIYCHLFVLNGPDLIPSPPHAQPALRHQGQNRDFALLLTCRTIFAEASPVAYANTVIRIFADDAPSPARHHPRELPSAISRVLTLPTLSSVLPQLPSRGPISRPRRPSVNPNLSSPILPRTGHPCRALSLCTPAVMFLPHEGPPQPLEAWEVVHMRATLPNLGAVGFWASNASFAVEQAVAAALVFPRLETVVVTPYTEGGRRRTVSMQAAVWANGLAEKMMVRIRSYKAWGLGEVLKMEQLSLRAGFARLFIRGEEGEERQVDMYLSHHDDLCRRLLEMGSLFRKQGI